MTHACNYRLQADREQAEFEAEWEELGQMVEQDRRMKSFMAQVSEWVSRSQKERSYLAYLVTQERAKVTSHGQRGEQRTAAEEAQQLQRKARTGARGVAREGSPPCASAPCSLPLTPPLALSLARSSRAAGALPRRAHTSVRTRRWRRCSLTRRPSPRSR